jgi:TIR domain
MNAVKIFLSHASEDQPEFVRPLAEALSAFSNEFKVWYSEYELTLGDRLLAKIDEGLKNCDYGVVVLSPHFFAKRWPREELDGLFQLETTERKVILPIWKDVSESDVKGFSPILASRLGADAALGVDRIVEEIRRAVGLVDRLREISSSGWKAKLRKLDEDVAHARKVETFSATGEAVELVSRVAIELIDEAWETGKKLIGEFSALKLSLPARKSERQYFTINGPNRLILSIRFVNSIEGARLKLGIFRWKDEWDENSKTEELEHHEFHPNFDKQMKILWVSPNLTFASPTALLDFAFDRFVNVLVSERTTNS